jgi:hypothetical protein
MTKVGFVAAERLNSCRVRTEENHGSFGAFGC